MSPVVERPPRAQALLCVVFAAASFICMDGVVELLSARYAPGS